MLGESLRFFGLGVRRRDGLVLEEVADEVAQEGLPVRGGAGELAEGFMAAHCFCRWVGE